MQKVSMTADRLFLKETGETFPSVPSGTWTSHWRGHFHNHSAHKFAAVAKFCIFFVLSKNYRVRNSISIGSPLSYTETLTRDLIWSETLQTTGFYIFVLVLNVSLFHNRKLSTRLCTGNWICRKWFRATRRVINRHGRENKPWKLRGTYLWTRVVQIIKTT